MKISQKQASLLAREIIRQLKLKKPEKISESLRAKLMAFVDKRKQLDKEYEIAREAAKAHENSIWKIVGKGTGIWGGERLEKMIETLEEKAIPKISEIEDEIILKSMFKSEEDMETFVNTIVKKYEKKLQSKVLQN